MLSGIQLRLFSWLVLVILPIAAAFVFTLQVVDNRLTQRVYAGLENDHRLEAARIQAALDQYSQYARGLAYSQGLQQILDDVTSQLALEDSTTSQSSNTSTAQRATSGPDSNTPLKATSELKARLQRVVERILDNARVLDAGVTEIKIEARNSTVAAKSTGFSIREDTDSNIEKSIESGLPIFGRAFENNLAEARFHITVPIFDHLRDDAATRKFSSEIIGVMIVELKLGPVVDLVVAHEGLGETSESHIAQPTAKGDAEFITLLRFARDAAFNKVVPKEKDLPINWSLESPQMRVVRSPDYRSVDSILAIGTIESTGWGLVVKIDADEAFAALADIRKMILIASCTSILLVLASWLLLISPLAKRLKTAAIAADKIAAGIYYSPINDPTADEIGALATRIDSLASDLNRDNALRKKVEQKLVYQSEHDALTGLFNRKYIQDVIENFDHTSNENHSILFLDLDGFKAINDSDGHHVGDEVLQQVASELLVTLDAECSVARWGGDEFVVLIPNADTRKAHTLAGRASTIFEQPFSTSAGEHTVGCSIGIGTTTDKISLADCVKNADANMYAAKQSNKREISRSDIVSVVSQANLLEERAHIWYQPIVETCDNENWTIDGVEALPLIRDSQGNLVPPTRCLEHVHEMPSGSDLDFFVLERALHDIATWQAAGSVSAEFYVSVSLCSVTLRTNKLPEFLNEQIEKRNLAPSSLVIGISEKNEEIDLDVLLAIKKIGVCIAVDDYGLRSFNLDRLACVSPDFAKVDKSWLNGIETRASFGSDRGIARRKRVVLEHMIATCHARDMRLIVSGVEANEQLAFLHAIGASRCQGYLFDAALPVEQLVAKLLGNQTANWTNQPHLERRQAN